MNTWGMSRTSLVYVHKSLSSLKSASMLELKPTAGAIDNDGAHLSLPIPTPDSDINCRVKARSDH